MEEVIKETIESYDGYIEKLEPGIEIIINLINEERYNQAKLSLINLIEGLLWLVEVNHKLNSLNQKCNLDIDKTNEVTKDLLEAIEKGDFYLCVDILNYELKGLVSSFKKFSDD